LLLLLLAALAFTRAAGADPENEERYAMRLPPGSIALMKMPPTREPAMRFS